MYAAAGEQLQMALSTVVTYLMRLLSNNGRLSQYQARLEYNLHTFPYRETPRAAETQSCLLDIITEGRSDCVYCLFPFCLSIKPRLDNSVSESKGRIELLVPY